VVEFEVKVEFRERCVEVFVQAMRIMCIDRSQYIGKALLTGVIKQVFERAVERWLEEGEK